MNNTHAIDIINTHFSSGSIDPVKNMECTKGKINNQSIPIWLHLLALPISSHITIGLAKIFDFEVLTHGTSLPNCYGILKKGADPSKGGSEMGSTFNSREDPEDSYIKNAKNHFYLFKDSEAKTGLYKEEKVTTFTNPPTKFSQYLDDKGEIFKEQQYRDLSFIENVALYLGPRIHAAFSGISASAHIDNKVKRIAAKVFHFISNLLFSPTLRFIYTLEETKRIFEDDPDYGGVAYRTSERLPNSRIGLAGVCLHANIEGFKRGVQKRPIRVVSGMVHLLAGSLLTCMGLGFFW
jgi:hypothetical protein